VADEDDEIRLEAIRSAGQVRSRRVVPALVEGLGDPVTASAAGDALSRFGDRVVGTLRDHLSDPSTAPEIRKKAASVLGRIGTASAAQALVEELLESDSTLRFRILSALNKIRQQHPDVEIDPQLVETVLAAEILGHYRSYQILGTLGADIEGHGSMAEALRHSMGREIERIFRLLGLLFPNHDFHSAHVGLQSKSQVVHDNALELLDNVLKPQFRGLLVPLLDGDVPFEQRVRLAERVVGSSVEGPEEAVASLLLSSEPWLKSCGAYAVGTLGLRSLERELEACLDHPDPLLRETARQAKRRLARGTSSG
jgi:AAA family ATP:ADP antiporter